MSLFQKSQTNYEWAEKILPVENKINSSVHCYYYSCFQLILHLLESKYNSFSNGGENSHEKTFIKFFDEFSKDSKLKIDTDTLSDLANFTTIIKIYRIKADYRRAFLPKVDYLDMQIKTKGILTTLTKMYNIPWKI